MNHKPALVTFVIALAVALPVAVSTALAHSAASSRAAEPGTPVSTADLLFLVPALCVGTSLRAVSD